MNSVFPRKWLCLAIFTFVFYPSQAQILIDTTAQTQILVQKLLDPGLNPSNITSNCLPGASARFVDNGAGLGIDSGLVLTSGSVFLIPGPNWATNASTSNSGGNNFNIASLTPFPVHDACSIDFDITPSDSFVSFTYVFGSEEYNEFVNTNYNDHMGIFISGPGISGTQNIPLIPGTNIPVSINSINEGTGNCQGPPNACVNCSYFKGNCNGVSLEYDGFTLPITSVYPVTPNQSYHIQIVVADVSDYVYDSGVFLKFGGIKGQNNPCTTLADISYTAFYDSLVFYGPGIPGTTYLWDFGDGKTDTVQNPVHVYDSSGIYQVCLKVIDACGIDSVCILVTIACTPPVADFSITKYGVSFIFQSTSLGLLLNGLWDFGDNTQPQSNMKSVLHGFSLPGEYKVCLTVSNYCGTDSICKDFQSCNFPFQILTSPLNRCVGEVFPLKGTNYSSLNYEWYIDDSIEGNLASFNYSFSQAGIHKVLLLASNSGCSFADSVIFNVIDAPPVPSFTYNVLPGNLVEFFASPGAGNWPYLWNFGDGDTSSVINPVHQYATAGYFYVCLTLGDGFVCEQNECEGIVSGILGVEETQSQFQFFPQPASQFLIFSNQTTNNANLEIFEPHGKLIFKDEKIGNGETEIQIGNWSEGIYFYRINFNERTYSGKLIIIK
ncbi:MAG: choice-of-anchor L domain-containing protein [Bacteroidia bacterium]|nr:choice-of-anchor L domain-containing protein [Bacteroidia bacterium]